MVLLFLICLEQDLVTPVLLDPHFKAVDRRVGISHPQVNTGMLARHHYQPIGGYI